MRNELWLEYMYAVDAVSSVSESSLARLAESLETHGAVFTGVGKSGMVAERAAATGRSVGLDTRFIHATEAMHGDGGPFREYPVVAFTHSGNTEETVTAMSLANFHGYPFLRFAITSARFSAAAHHANVGLFYGFADAYKIPLGSLVTMSLIIDTAILVAGDIDSLKTTHMGGTLGRTI